MGSDLVKMLVANAANDPTRMSWDPSKTAIYSNSQKVAALLIALGPDCSSKVMKHFDEEHDVEAIALEITAMNRVPPDIMAEILKEFFIMFKAKGLLATGGVAYARDLLKQTFGDQRADSILERLVSTLETMPFEFFNGADADQLATSFQNENPQLIALVLSYLRPKHAANVIGLLSPELQAEVAIRVADMDRTNPDVLREVERIMENKFSSVMATDFSQAGGVESLAEILNYSDRSTERAIMEALELRKPDLVQEVRELMFVFEDITYLDNRSVQRLLREVDTKDLGIALKGAKDAVKEKIFQNMSDRAAAMLQEDMSFMGPIKSKDVMEKQSHIVNIVRHLESTGEIQISRGGEEDALIE
jgi:flagellar motor switch protein FliG